jgi:hypothetical protein
MADLREVTGFEAGLTGDQQIQIALKEIVDKGGKANMAELYKPLERCLNENGQTLSDQGKASYRFFINKVAVEAGYLYPYEKDQPGWRITPQGREFVTSDLDLTESTVDVDTGREEEVLSNTAKGAAFELYVQKLLKAAYSYYAWYYQGIHKRNERGLDFIGNRIGDAADEPKSIGVQVKFYAAKSAPTQIEWLKFLSGCFARRVESAIFITTGKLTSEQRREAQEARITIIEGREEISRLSKLHKIGKFDLFE